MKLGKHELDLMSNILAPLGRLLGNKVDILIIIKMNFRRSCQSITQLGLCLPILLAASKLFELKRLDFHKLSYLFCYIRISQDSPMAKTCSQI